MSRRSLENNRHQRSLPIGYILYRPKTRTTMELIQINSDASSILSSLLATQKTGNGSNQDLSLLCAHWRGLLNTLPNDELLNKMKEKGKTLKDRGEVIDLFQSGRRYAVKGTVFSSPPSLTKRQSKEGSRCLFILERIEPDTVMNLTGVLRNAKLNRREQEIIKLLLSDRSNKEIAQALGLSLNTVKGYLKLLMRKLGVSSRTGIVAHLMIRGNFHL
jgi:DNA-binding CsgD family transcriptional regulator